MYYFYLRYTTSRQHATDGKHVIHILKINSTRLSDAGEVVCRDQAEVIDDTDDVTIIVKPLDSNKRMRVIVNIISINQ